MTERNWLRVGAWLLGIYWLVVAAMSVPLVLLAAGTVTEPYASKWLYVTTPLLQAVIATIAGLVLCRWSSRSMPTERAESSDHAGDSLVAPALQLFGVFALVDGSRDLAGLARRFSYSKPWPTDLGEMLSAIVGVALGLALILRAGRLAVVLRRYRLGA
jgi:FtsH-binding integral membrane protein